jgi:helix-turn-helix protein/regulatory GntR family protein
MTVAERTGTWKWEQVAASVRSQIADGTLRPGQSAPSGAALGRATGFSELTCRKALRRLIKDGVLVPGPSQNARPRVAGPLTEGHTADAAAFLSAALAARRRAAGLTQPDLAALVGFSVTTVGHAETGRLWQSRQFWERADAVLGADGNLLGLHDAYCVAVAAKVPEPESPSVTPTTEAPPPAEAPPTPETILIVWTDGAITAVPVNRETC